VQNRREMVEALGALGDPAAIEPLIEALRHDAYVPVRAAAATALARIGGSDRRVVAALTAASHHDTEPMVVAAARAALASAQRGAP
jgi:HEAT repeat protein